MSHKSTESSLTGVAATASSVPLHCPSVCFSVNQVRRRADEAFFPPIPFSQCRPVFYGPEVAEQIIAQCRAVGAGHFLTVLHWGAAVAEIAEAHEQFGSTAIPLLRQASV